MLHDFGQTVKIDIMLNRKKWSSRKYYYYRRLIRDLSETDMPDQRTVGDQHDSSKTHRDQHASLETNMPDPRSIRDPSETCLIRHRHASSDTNPGQDMYFLWVSGEECWSAMGLRWVFDEACRSPMRHISLPWVSTETCWSPIRHDSLQ